MKVSIDYVAWRVKRTAMKEEKTTRRTQLGRIQVGIDTCVFAKRLSAIISELVDPNQHGFIPDHDTTSHLKTVITALEMGSFGGSPPARYF
ncbi:hypothetical protein NDU88_000857 [Pleurodeles waltl]|uniref:Uncharacterized protein n=1 Tax=Pleurodeles waltl TaxID=8319 RepID=A0AAV7SAP6_PLEWA|nr:hypothetical protein NDU88_000857 [Pleurodeles waltl]